ncbi:hypothetical protein Bca101_011659 [Brassica carinata]
MEWDSDAQTIVKATHMLISIYTDAPKTILFKCLCVSSSLRELFRNLVDSFLLCFIQILIKVSALFPSLSLSLRVEFVS